MIHLLLLASVLASSDTLSYSGRGRELEVTPTRFEAPRIRIDGHLEEPEWAGAAVLRDFTQYEPVEGIPATENTEVRVLYSADAIYFGIQAFDSEPGLILARLGERDRAVFGDDWIRIILDTFDDQRQGYVFYVNPLGIQTDGLWIEGLRRQEGRASTVSIDFSPDFIWDSDGHVNDRGWEAEIRVPYVSLRFRDDPVQTWGINVAREVKRRGFKQSWAPLTQNVSSTLAQSGKLVGLRDLRPKRLVELNPVTTGKRLGDDASGEFRRGGFEGEIGFNARYGVTQNLVLDATANPDFSQVEADASRITVNERFALFFPEKRPFFLEGTEVFQTPQQLVYTRRVVDPIGGAKITGKVGAFTLGYLGALDESPSSIFGGSGKAAVNLFRARRDVGAASNLGVLYTDRILTEGGDYNRVLAGDARLVFKDRFTFTTQLAGSWTSENGSTGPLRPSVFASLGRSGRNMGWDLTFHDLHPEFRADAGYLPRIGEAVTVGNLTFTRYGGPGALVERAALGFRVEGYFDHDDFWEGRKPYEAEVQLLPSFSLRGDRTISIILRNGYFKFPPDPYGSYEVLGPGGEAQPFVIPAPLTNMKALAVLPRLRLNNSSNLNGRFYLREVPIYSEGSRGLELLIAPQLSLKPTTALSLTLDETFSRLWRSAEDTVFSTAVVTRLTTQYQFGKAVFARALIQYNLEDRAALRDPSTGRPILINGSEAVAREGGTVQGQFLLQYQPSPGTIFYVGYSRMMEGDYSYGLGGKSPTQEGLFVKLSYLFRV
ncbi:MAG: DUF5916 domain-containing protein [Longimicrobiales bacterium]